MKKFVIIKGGLGNQMFQYALALAMRRRGYDVTIDISSYNFVRMHNGYELEKVFGISEKLINAKGIYLYMLRFLHKFTPRCLTTNDVLTFKPIVFTSPRLYVQGYWQDEKYFADFKNDLFSVFEFKKIDNYNLNVATEMKSCDSVSIHIRRGDYKAYGMTIIKDDYYEKAVRKILDIIPSPIFYIFSDDPIESENIAKNLHIKYKLVTHNNQENSYKDMYLMSQCKHNIIANSSFSWWGAWLNTNKDKMVIAPKVWDNDVEKLHPQCSDWILL